MNAKPSLCVELSGCIANNLNFAGVPDFGPIGSQTLSMIGAVEALAWLNGPFAFSGEVHITISSSDCDFHERAMEWLEELQFSIRTGVTEEHIHPYETLNELTQLTNGMRPTAAVSAHVEPLAHILLADFQLLLDPQATQQRAYHAMRQSIRGARIIRVNDWREIMRYAMDSLPNTAPT